MLLFTYSIFSDCQSLKIEYVNNSIKTEMQKFDHGSLIYGIIGTQERVLVSHGKQAIRVRASEVLLYCEES